MYAEKTDYDDIEMSSRLRNVLRRNGFESLEGVREYPKEYFIKFRNMGQATLQELYQICEEYEETYENVPEFCYSASFDEVKEKGFTLVPSRYIEFVNRDENIDFDTKMKSLQGELKELLAQEEKSKSDLLAVFKELGYEIEL